MELGNDYTLNNRLYSYRESKVNSKKYLEKIQTAEKTNENSCGQTLKKYKFSHENSEEGSYNGNTKRNSSSTTKYKANKITPSYHIDLTFLKKDEKKIQLNYIQDPENTLEMENNLERRNEKIKKWQNLKKCNELKELSSSDSNVSYKIMENLEE